MLKQIKGEIQPLSCQSVSQKENNKDDDNHQVTNLYSSSIKFYKKISNTENQGLVSNLASSFRLLNFKRNCSCFEIKPCKRFVTLNATKVSNSNQKENVKQKNTNNVTCLSNILIDRDHILKMYS